jgi:hypothetical protein
MRYKKAFCGFVIFFSCLIFLSAEVSLEEVIQAGRYMFYRDHAEPHKYYYIPDQPRLATRPDGTPEFTFIKYTKTGEDIKGGVVHFLVTWGLSGSEISTAEASLQMIDPEAELAGPVPFKEGSFKIISSTAGDEGLFNVKICGEGKAPIMPGQKGAVSIALTQEGATLLWESFKNPTSDVSVVFNLTYAGITPAYEAKLKVDWDKVYSHHDISLSGSGIVKAVKLESELRAIFDQLRQEGAIELEVTGESEDMEGLLNVAYGHLIKLMCSTEIATDSQVKDSKSGKIKRPSRTIKRKKKDRGYQIPGDFNPAAQSPDGSSPGGDFIGVNPKYSSEGFARVIPQEQKEEFPDKELLMKAKEYEKAGNSFRAVKYYSQAYKTIPLDADLGELLHIAKLAEEVSELEIAGIFYSNYSNQLLSHKNKDESDFYEKKSEDIFQAVEHHAAGIELYKKGSYRLAYRMFTWGQRNSSGTHYKTWYYLALNEADTALNSTNETLNYAHFVNNARKYYEKMQSLNDKYPGMFSEKQIQEVKNKIEQAESLASKKADKDKITATSEQTKNEEKKKKADKKIESDEQDKANKKDVEEKIRPEDKKTAASQSKTPKKAPKKSSATKSKASSNKVGVNPPYNLKLAYTFKRVEMSGHYEVDLRHRLREDRVMVMSGNIGDLFQRYNEDERFFSSVFLDDPVFEERIIEVILDGQDFDDFKNYINSVSVMFKKERWGDPATTGEVKFFDEQFADKGNRLTFVYGRGGEGSSEWLNYQYKTKWSFYGGIEWENDWIETSDSVITLTPVADYRTVQISLDSDNLEKFGIRAAAFQIKHQIFGKDVLREVIIDPHRGDPLQAEYEYLHEEGSLGYQYKIIWLLNDGREIQSDWIERETPVIYAYYQE